MLKLVTDEDLKYNLDEIVRLGAKKMLMKALQAEVDDFIQSNKDKVDESGRRLIVRNGKAQRNPKILDGLDSIFLAYWRGVGTFFSLAIFFFTTISM